MEVTLSAERLATYQISTGGERAEAMRLYAWNTAVSAAFYGPLQALEVTLRNAMNRALSSEYGQKWYDNDDTGLDGGCLARIKETRKRLQDEYPDEAPHMIAALTFGFWVQLLGPGGIIDKQARTKANYEMTLWRPALRRAFPHAKEISRKQVQVPLNSLRKLRNRIAHHEPIFNRKLRNLEQDYEKILEVVSWMSPQTRKWIEAYSRVLDLLATPPDASVMKF